MGARGPQNGVVNLHLERVVWHHQKKLTIVTFGMVMDMVALIRKVTNDELVIVVDSC